MSAIENKRVAKSIRAGRPAACPAMRSKLSFAIAAALYGATAVHGLPAAAASASTSPADSLQEITVTARKRTENLQDVPQSIDVFTSKDLENLSISQFEDYATKTPSVSFISAGPPRRCSSCAACPTAATPTW